MRKIHLFDIPIVKVRNDLLLAAALSAILLSIFFLISCFVLTPRDVYRGEDFHTSIDSRGENVILST